MQSAAQRAARRACRGQRTAGGWPAFVHHRVAADAARPWRARVGARHGAGGGTAAMAAAAAAKTVWLQTSSKAAFQAALEAGGVDAFVFGPDPAQRALADEWAALARFEALLLDGHGALTEPSSDGQRLVGEVVPVDGPDAARALEARVAAMAAAAAEAGSQNTHGEALSLVLDASDWKVIPAENLVALAQHAASPAPATSASASSAGASSSARLRVRLLATASSLSEARLMLEALQAGTSGVLLRSEDPAEVRNVLRYVEQRAAEEAGAAGPKGGGGLPYEVAVVREVRQLGMGDRACVDLATLMQPGEGMLVGSFARCLALVQSEVDESAYISSRPFRVNAGPVHAYAAAPGGRTRYLSELRSGSEVLVADAAGRCRTALVGRVKIERRPLVLVEVETADGCRHSAMLQNAETVKLVGPATAGARIGAVGDAAAAGLGGPASRAWRAVSVAALQPGDEVFVLLQTAARHAGNAIEEFIVEK